MYSSWTTVPKHVILIHVLAIQVLLINSELPLNTTHAYINHKCLVSQGKFTPESKYGKLFKNIMKMFYIDSLAKEGWGMTGDSTFSAILQCRGDSYGPKCQDCFVTALAALGRRCPGYKGRIIWYDQCLLSISAGYSIGQIDYNNNFCMSNAKNSERDKLVSMGTWNKLMDNLTTLATIVDKDTNTSALYSTGKRRVNGDILYGMVQCTKDLFPQACLECMVYNSIHFQYCLTAKRGARFMSRSCTFRFEFYPFIAGSKYLND